MIPYSIICFDKKHKPLIGYATNRIPINPGSPEKYNYQYKRNGTANIFVAVDFKGGKRNIMVIDRRIKKDFAFYIKHLVNKVFSDAKNIIIKKNIFYKIIKKIV
ncbi:MAG: hypothetical protein LBB45_05380 [Methanobrevibacter sp.]|jgi:hypothetical protein|nr:hypothetical protein [Candidatus Methanovirga basalitermitum]